MICSPFTIDPELRVARTPPGSFYDDEELHRTMNEVAFASSWQALPDPPALQRFDQVPLRLLPGSLDEPILLVHDGERERALSNVCTHRGALLVDAARRGKRVACPYHGRCFSLGGEVLAAPGFAGREAELPPLPELLLASLGPIRWLAREGTPPLAHVLASLDAAAPGLPWERLVSRPDLGADYEVDAHWALYVENYLEGLHIPFVHPGLDQAVERASYRSVVVPGGVLQTAQVRGKGPTLPGGAAALYLWLFPNTMLNVYPWGVSLNVVQPETTRRCRVAFRSFVWAPEHLGAGAGAGLDAVELEDEAVVARVRRGVGAGLYGRGHYADPAETGVHHFHRLLTGALWG
ncbi:MAG: Rieske 2Fe-2S domain-containing protein [Deltaproteobacteria bacterium]|nr:Rieske 2Fe-2S domain-containing protein [Deltaproteobacteria bacterium]